MVSRTARLCTSGISTSPRRLATKKPMPKNMIGSIMDGGLRPGMMPNPKHGTAERRLPELPAFSVNAASGSDAAPRDYGGDGDRVSERVPRRLWREFQIADVGAEPQTHARPDRHQHDVVGGQRRHAEAADKIGGTV